MSKSLKRKKHSLNVSLFVSLIRSSKAHPGPVVHISDNPMDEGKVKDNTFLSTHTNGNSRKLVKIYMLI